jgi:integrase
MSKVAIYKEQSTRSLVTMPRRRVVVSEQVQAYLNVSRSANTVKGYVADVRSFLRWGGRIPSRPEVVAEFLADEAETKAFATIRRKNAAIGLAHRELGYASPSYFEVVKGTLRGIKRAKPYKVRQKRPLVAEQVIAATKGLNGVAGARDRAILMIGFAGAFRQSELVGLNVEDCGMRDGCLVIALRSSKTDQLSEGREVVIPRGRGRKCPVKALLEWLKISRISAGPIFRRVDRSGVVLGGRVGAGIVSRIVKEGANSIGLDPRGFGGHSLRAGYVTTAAARGVPIWAIKRQTGHSSETMIETYIRPTGAMPNMRLL